jgi:3'-5' exoribonuclease Rv2179c-like domain
MTIHTMIDTETLGTRPGAVVLAAALVRFNDEASTSLNLDSGEQQRLGLTVDQATLDWWQQQGADVLALSTANPVPLVPALQHISAWIAWAAGGSTDFLIWCHGASFDCPLLEAVYKAAGVPCPWNFWQIRDTRTLYDLAGINVKDYAVPPPHIALNDAIGQTRAAVAALKVIAERRGVTV